MILHSPAPPVGSVAVTTFPALSPIAQNRAVGQETEPSWWSPGSCVVCHAADPPVGLVDVNMSSVPFVATHSSLVGHETADGGWYSLSTAAAVQALAPPIGSFDARTLPSNCVAAHVPLGEQETDVSSAASPWVLSMRLVVHVPAPPVGSVELTTSPPLSTATHSVVVGHAIPVIAGPWFGLVAALSSSPSTLQTGEADAVAAPKPRVAHSQNVSTATAFRNVAAGGSGVRVAAAAPTVPPLANTSRRFLPLGIPATAPV